MDENATKVVAKAVLVIMVATAGAEVAHHQGCLATDLFPEAK